MSLYRFEYRDDMAYDLTDLELFLQVVDQGSITQGAEHTHLSLASASARITAMEKALGAKLLDRHRRGVVPSPTAPCRCAAHRDARYRADISLAHNHRPVLSVGRDGSRDRPGDGSDGLDGRSGDRYQMCAELCCRKR